MKYEEVNEEEMIGSGFVIKNVDLNRKTVAVRTGSLTFYCRVLDDNYIMKPRHIYIEDGLWNSFLGLVLRAWEEANEEKDIG